MSGATNVSGMPSKVKGAAGLSRAVRYCPATDERLRFSAHVTANHYRPTPSRALVVSTDPLVGALIGAAVELAGLEVSYPAEGQDARDGLRTVRPTHLLLESDDPSVRDEMLLGNALMFGTRILVFGSDRQIAAVESLAERYRASFIVLPRDVDRLPEILATAGPGSSLHPPRSTVR